jgi:hypothetical protein
MRPRSVWILMAVSFLASFAAANVMAFELAFGSGRLISTPFVVWVVITVVGLAVWGVGIVWLAREHRRTRRWW